jgi:hypothetical protein
VEIGLAFMLISLLSAPSTTAKKRRGANSTHPRRGTAKRPVEEYGEPQLTALNFNVCLHFHIQDFIGDEPTKKY